MVRIEFATGSFRPRIEGGRPRAPSGGHKAPQERAVGGKCLGHYMLTTFGGR